jgi:hypothetical protein
MRLPSIGICLHKMYVTQSADTSIFVAAAAAAAATLGSSSSSGGGVDTIAAADHPTPPRFHRPSGNWYTARAAPAAGIARLLTAPALSVATPRGSLAHGQVVTGSSNLPGSSNGACSLLLLLLLAQPLNPALSHRSMSWMLSRSTAGFKAGPNLLGLAKVLRE